MRIATAVLLLAAGWTGLMVVVNVVADAVVVPAGALLWRGERPLVARIAGHTSTLPPQATRCINCHGPAATPVRREAPTPAAGTIPVLTADHLRQTVARRGGPPSRYDVTTFCQVLRSGIDPAAVLLPRAMPRYEIGEADCTALWQYLTVKAPHP